MSVTTAVKSQPETRSEYAEQPKVLISILNWNRAEKTRECLLSLKEEIAGAGADVTVLVIDNGSSDDDFASVQQAVASSEAVLKRMPHNLGFTGGHNVAIELAIRENYEFIWLLNNDAIVERGTLRELLSVMRQDSRCGVVSPVLRDTEDGTIRRCVNVHQWNERTYTRIVSFEEAERLQKEEPASLWVDGTAVLFRIKALVDTGPLDDRLFAYYDDNDIGVRLAQKGWYSRCAFKATVLHDYKKSMDEFPRYLVYLLQRNEMLFWYKNMLGVRRPVLWLKLVDRALFDVARLYKRGFDAHADAALLGVQDFMLGRFGPPAHERKVPLLMRAACRLSGWRYSKKLVPASQS
jgi:GT2 family glycosyltransferase